MDKQQKEKQIEKLLYKINYLGYITKRERKGIQIIEIYQSILNNKHIIEHECAYSTNPNDLKFLKEIYIDLLKN